MVLSSEEGLTLARVQGGLSWQIVMNCRGEVRAQKDHSLEKLQLEGAQGWREQKRSTRQRAGAGSRALTAREGGGACL